MAGTLAPCFIPATLLAGGTVFDVSVTRLASRAAQLSGDVPCQVGGRLQMEMDRPTDGVRVRLLVHVTAVHREGVQWGWKPSIHVTFDQPLETALEPGDEPALPDPMEERSSISDSDSISFSFSGMDTGSELPVVKDGPTPTPTPTATEEESFSFEVPDQEPDLASITLPGFEDSRDDGEDDDEPEIVPQVIEPNVHTLDDIVPDVDRASISAEIAPPWDAAETTDPPWEGPEDDPAGQSLSGGLDEQPVRPLPRRPGARAPWSEPSAGHAAVEEREARIFSQVTVSYLAAGQKRFGTAQDFSRQGLFLAIPDEDPLPRMGAIVRVGFPIEFPDDLVVVRMTTEVRWNYGDDAPDAPGRGVGLQISAFDSAAEQRCYEDYTRSIIDNTPGPRAPEED